MIVIGSRALKYWYSEAREPKDYDVIGTQQELSTYVKKNYEFIKSCKSSRPGKVSIRLYSGKLIEFELENTSHIISSCDRIAWMHEHHTTMTATFPEVNIEALVCVPEVLLAIKKSHLFVPLRHWDKHMEDYHLLLKKVPRTNQRNNEIKIITTLRQTETQERLGVKKAKLGMTNDQFFQKSEKGVQRFYVHDDLHRATCYYNEPLFTKIKVNPELATCDHKLFEALSPLDQIRAVREEAFSIALERKIIPAIELNKEVDPGKALQYALFRICTTLTSGWFRSFAQDHYYEILNSDIDYVSKFQQAVEKGTVVRIAASKAMNGEQNGNPPVRQTL